MSHPPLHIKGALIWQGAEAIEKDLFIQNGRIVSEKPNHALEVDLSGYTLFPGLVNAHDHLELNHFPRTKFREVYDNAHQWGEDVNARLNDEPFKTLRSYPLWDKLFIGGLKNLLCGATTVAHHGPKHKPMYWADFPVRVLKNYGWAHSLHFSTEEEIVHSYQSTPKNWPWFIHLAEGTDETAASEYQRLKKLGCVGENTVLVHGVGLNLSDIVDACYVISNDRLAWCPSTNDYILGCIKDMNELWEMNGGRIYLGSDSRLTSKGDLLDEIRYVKQLYDWQAFFILQFVLEPIYSNYPEIGFWFNLRDNILKRNMIADFVAVQDVNNPSDYLCSISRKELSLVATNSIPQIGAPELMAKFPHIQTVACTLDGVEKRINVELARQIHRCTLKEQGLEVDTLPSNKKFIFF
jgi:hypothetical protein